MLAEVYSWFTEGFDTKDLQEAQALLEELHGSKNRQPRASLSVAIYTPSRKTSQKFTPLIHLE